MKKYLLVSIIVIAIFVFGCLEIGGQRNVTGIKKTVANETITNITLPNVTKVASCEELLIGKDECLIERAYKNNNINDCRQLKNDSFKQCIYRIAERSTQYCSLLDEISAIDNCYFNISTKVGDQVCSYIVNSSKKETCTLQFVSEACRSVKNESDRYICDAIAKNSAEICNKSPLKDTCYLKFSKSVSDKCSLIENTGLKLACTGILTNTTTGCSTVVGVLRDNCIRTIATETSNCALCENVIDSVYKDGCFSDCAIAAKDSKQCSKPSDEQKRDNCYYNYALANNDEITCKEVRLLSLLKFCVEKVSINKAAPASCEAMLVEPRIGGTPTQGEVNTCYYAVMGQSNVSATACISISSNSTSTKEQCIYSYAKRTLDTSFCSSISDSSLMQACQNLK